MREDQILSWLSLTGPDAEARAVVLRQRLAAGERDLGDYFLAETEREPRAALRVERLHDHLTLLIGPFLHAERPVAPSALSAMMRAAFVRAEAHQTDQIGTRPLAGVMRPALSAVLTELGFADCGLRIEYRSPVADLPDDAGNPLTWQSLDVVGEEEAAAMFARTNEGDPHGLEPGEDPRAVIAGYLVEEGLTHGPDCIQIGYQGGEPVAFVCAQVSRSDGWSRITYMGLAPEARGRKLGTWVHRRGFTMLKAQDGQLYHGGTAASNAAMVHLFQRHGCVEFRRMFEWLWVRPHV